MNKNTFPPLLTYQYYCIIVILSFSMWKYHFVSLFILFLFIFFFKQKESFLYTIIIILCSYAFSHYFFYQNNTAPNWYSSDEHYLIRATVHDVKYLSEKRQRIVLTNIIAHKHITFQRIKKNTQCVIPENSTHIYNTKQFCVVGREIPSTKSLTGKAVWTLKDNNTKIFRGQEIEGIFQISNIHGSKNNNTFDIEQYWKENSIYYRARLKTNNTEAITIKKDTFIAKFQDFLHTKLYSTLLPLRNKDFTEKSFEKYKEEMSYAIIEALLLGSRYSFSTNLEKLLVEATLFHSLVLSGMHLSCLFIFSYCIIMLISFLYPQFFFFLPKQKALILFMIPFAIFYALLSGFPLSFTRALTMLIISSIFFYYNSTNTLFDTLFIALIALFVYNPTLLFSLSLQLSILCVFAIYCSLPFVRKIRTLCFSLKSFPLFAHILFSLSSILCISFFIQIFLLPLILTHFGTVPYFFVLNIIWLPILSIILLPSLILAYIFTLLNYLFIAQYIFSYSSRIIIYLLDFLYFLRSKEFLFSFVDIKPHILTNISYCLALYAFYSFYMQKSKNKKYLYASVLSLILLCIPIVSRKIETLDSSLKIEILDVGHGQAILLEHEGKRMLIDAGANSSTFDVGERIITPYLTYNKKPYLDALLISHQDNDHLGGALYLLKTFSINTIYYNGDHTLSTNVIKQFLSIINKRKTGIHIMSEGDAIHLTKELYCEILAPNKSNISAQDSNANSIAFRLVFKNKTVALILGDLDNKGQKYIVENYIEKDENIPIIIMPHHGSKNNFYSPLYTKGTIQYAIASTNKINTVYLSKEMRDFFNKEKISLLTTYRNGAVSINIKNETLSIKTQRAL